MASAFHGGKGVVIPTGVEGSRPTGVTGVGHEVDAATLDAHAHDHAHGKKASWRVSAHEHSHLHRGDAEADGQLNGHIHARAHAGLPWEHPDPAQIGSYTEPRGCQSHRVDPARPYQH